MSYEQMAARRRERLLGIYPLDVTTRQDVAKKWEPLKPELSFQRPASGWLALDPRYAGEHLDAVEKNARENIASFERYFGVDGILSLCRCWFFYDAEGKLIDVEWQYVSD